MKVLAVNAGSSSLKFTAYEMPEEKVLMSGVFERIGINGGFYTIKFNGEKTKTEIELKDHKQAFELLVKELKEHGLIEKVGKFYYVCDAEKLKAYQKTIDKDA